MILITGATGTIGSEAVRRLAARGEAVRAMTRNPRGASVPSGVEVVRGDFDEPATLADAAAGATAVLLLSAPGPSLPQHDTAMLDAARAAGVRTVVKLSSIGTGLADAPEVGAWHEPGEAAVRASGMAWTLLRPSSFASNALRWVDAIRSGNPISSMTGAGAQGVVDPRDVAAVAVEALTSLEHAGRVYTPTGPELLGVPDQAARLGEVLGRTVTTVDMPLDAGRQRMLAAGLDEAFVDVVINGAAYTRAGGSAVLTDDVERVLGRPPGSFETWVRDHRDAFGD